MTNLASPQPESTITYFDIAFRSSFDGPGSRVVLFFQGCHARCVWCHSPHSQPRRSPLLFNDVLCSHCGGCVSACAEGVHEVTPTEHRLSRQGCQSCGVCIRQCPNTYPHRNVGALQLPTETLAVDRLYAKLLPHLKLSSGITLSGGEALLQSSGARQLLQRCQQAGIHTAVETSGLLPPRFYQNLQGLVDYWLFGMRFTTDYPRTDHTDKIYRAFETIHRYQQPILPRIPIVPEHTDTDWYLNRCLALLSKYDIAQVALNPWNHNTDHYYRQSGTSLTMAMPSQAQALASEQKVRQFFRAQGIEPIDIQTLTLADTELSVTSNEF